MTFQLKDSGKREDFETGARRDVREGKGRFDLISPRFLRRLAVVMEKGAKKYGDRNWEKGIPLGRYLDSALRHINCLLFGLNDEDHAAQAAFNIQGFIHTAELILEGKLPRSLDDIGFFTDEEFSPDVAEEPARSADFVRCDDPGCVGCHPKDAGPPATSSESPNALASRIAGYLQDGFEPVGQVIDDYAALGYPLDNILEAAKLLRVETCFVGGNLCWRLPVDE